jgi:hypothetical protein
MSDEQTPTDTPTRENCQRCGRRGFAFIAPDDTWLAVAGDRWQHGKLCLVCFADLGDEKNVAWEVGVEFGFCSIRTHHDMFYRQDWRDQ